MTSSPAAVPPAPAPVVRPPAWAFWCGLLLTAAWLALIAWLTWTSSNPVTLNRRQIHDSDVVLVGQVAKGEPLVEPVPDQPWPLSDKKPIRIANLSETRAQTGHRYLFPLKRAIPQRAGAETETFLVTPSTLPNSEPLIYPAGPEAMSQLKQILQEPRPSAIRRKAALPPRQPAARD